MLLPRLAVALGALLLVATVVFAYTLHLSLVDAIYFVTTTATTTGYGDFSLRHQADWLKLLGCLVMLSGGALLAILFSQLAAVATAERLDQQMRHRARRLAGHVVVAGLGNVGYRVVRLLTEVGIPVVALELNPRARFAEALRERVVVVTGDAALPESLELAAIQKATAFLACTDDDLVNIQACLCARSLNPEIRTAARIFDDLLAEHLTTTYKIDTAISTTRMAARAFIGAAIDERARRPFRMGETAFVALRFDPPAPIARSEIREWQSRGVRLLAIQRRGCPVQHASDPVDLLEPGDSAIIAGPEEAIDRLLAESVAAAA